MSITPFPTSLEQGKKERSRRLSYGLSLALRGLGYLVILAMFYWFFRRMTRNPADWEKLRDTSLTWVPVLFGLITCFAFLNGLVTRTLAKGFSISLSFLDWFGLAVANTFLNYLPLRTGPLFKAGYLKAKHGLDYAKFGSMFAASYVLLVGVSGVTGLGATAALASGAGDGTRLWFLVAFFAILAAVSFAFFFVPAFSSEKPALRFLVRVLRAWAQLRGQKRTVVTLVGITLLILGTLACRILLVFHMLGHRILIAQAVILGNCTIIGVFVSFMPGGLGTKEGLFIIASRILGLDLDVSIFAAALDRLVAMAWVMIFGPPFSLALWSRVRKLKAAPAPVITPNDEFLPGSAPLEP